MQLDELIKSERFDNIIKSTHISKVMLERLLNREFGLMKKPQVIGTIAILEREYDVDLSDLRKECNEYYESKGAENIGLIVGQPIIKENNFLPKLFVLILLFLVVYGAWYFFKSYYKPAVHDINLENEKSFMDIIIEGKDTIMEKVRGKSDDPIVVKVESKDLIMASNRSKEPKVEEKNDIISTKSTTPEKQITQADKTTQDIPTVESRPVEEQKPTVEESKKVSEANSTTNSVDPLDIKREKITILPQKTMWFQLINMDTKRLLKFKRKDQYDIIVKDHGWLFSTKNSTFAFIDNDIFEEYGGKGKIFFRLDKDGIHPLTQDEYNQLRKRR